MSDTEDITFTLLENGLDFVRSGLEHVSKANRANDYKYGILHLHAGLVLILKSRLAQEGWRLVVAGKKIPSFEDFQQGNFKSVGLDDVLERLDEQCGVDFKDGDKHFAPLRLLRNKVEHFGFTTTATSVKSLAALTVNALIEFMSEEISPSTGAEKRLLRRIRTLLRQFDEFVAERIHEIEPILQQARSDNRSVFLCPLCVQVALLPDCETECAFCGAKQPAEQTARTYISTVLRITEDSAASDGDDYPISNCPECNLNALVDTGHGGDTVPTTQCLCFSCGSEFEDGTLKKCAYCGNFEYHDSFVGDHCSDCWRSYIDWID